jgi:hypothetical protein
MTKCPIAIILFTDFGTIATFIGTSNQTKIKHNSAATKDILSNTEYYDNNTAYNKLLFGIKIVNVTYDKIYYWDTISCDYRVINNEDSIVIYAFPSRVLLCYKSSQIYCYYVDNSGNVSTTDIDEGEISFSVGYSYYIKNHILYNVTTLEGGYIPK